MARRTKSPARKALPSWLQHQEEQPHDALVEGIVLDLPWIKGGDGKVVARELRGQGPFKGEPEKLAASERAAYYEARKHQPWRRPPRSHRPYGLKWWDVVSAALTVAALAAHAVGAYHNQPLTALGVAWRLPAALALVDLLTGLTHGLFDGQLARYKHPRDVVFMDTLPRNAMGKVLKFELRDMVSQAGSG